MPLASLVQEFRNVSTSWRALIIGSTDPVATRTLPRCTLRYRERIREVISVGRKETSKFQRAAPLFRFATRYDSRRATLTRFVRSICRHSIPQGTPLPSQLSNRALSTRSGHFVIALALSMPFSYRLKH